MSEKVEEIKRWVALNEDQKLDEVMTIMESIPATDRIKLVMYLTKQAPSLCESQFFVRFADQTEVIKLTEL